MKLLTEVLPSNFLAIVTPSLNILYKCIQFKYIAQMYVWAPNVIVFRGAGATGAAAHPALCSRWQRGQLCLFLIAIELFYHPNNFASDVRNVINESELIVVGRHWSF